MGLHLDSLSHSLVSTIRTIAPEQIACHKVLDRQNRVERRLAESRADAGDDEFTWLRTRRCVDN